MTPEEWERRKKFVDFSAVDVELLQELHIVARTYADEVMEDLYRRWLAHEELRAFFRDDEHLARVKAAQRKYFISLTEGDYGMRYLADRLRIGRVHRRIGLEPRWYMGAYAVYLQIVVPRVMHAFEYDRARRAKAVSALLKVIALDQELAMLTYFEDIDVQPRTP